MHIASRKSNRSRPPYYVPKKLPIPSAPAGYPKSRSYKKSQSPPPHSPVGFPENQIYNVLSFGAVGNGVKDDTQAFKNTWNAACQAQISTSSAVFLVPYKFSFMIQPIIFTGPCKSRLVFQIDGTLVPPDGPKQWPQNTNKQDWLLFKGVHGMLMQGNGLINGRGEKWWDLPCKPHKGGSGPCDSPSIIRFSKGSDLSVQGLRLENSPKVHLRFDSCQPVN
ncbi:hypothetical protein CerSpe_230190 [Prunus speciosa]